MSNPNDVLNWFVEEIQFDTLREAHEWIYSDAYNAIGYLFDGYKSKDPRESIAGSK